MTDNNFEIVKDVVRDLKNILEIESEIMITTSGDKDDIVNIYTDSYDKMVSNVARDYWNSRPVKEKLKTLKIKVVNIHKSYIL